MSLVKIYVHVVWSTHNRMPSIQTENRKDLYAHMLETAKKKGIEIDSINGWSDHIHLLIRLHQSQNLSEIIHAIKGESSFWFNNEYERADYTIKWQRSYFAVSINYGNLHKVRQYIDNQEQYHQNSEFIEEYHMFLKENGFELNSEISFD